MAAGLLVGGAALWQSDQFQIGERISDANAKLAHELEHATEKFLTYNGKDEFRPKTTTVRPAQPRANRPLLEASAGSMVVDATSKHVLRAQLTTSTHTLVTINQLYLPGWIVTVNGRRMRQEMLRANLLPDGRMRLPIRVTAEGQSEEFSIAARYTAPNGEREGTALALLALLLLSSPQLVALARRSRDAVRRTRAATY